MQAVQVAHRQTFESFLQRDLWPLEHGEALGRFANFISYSLGDHVGARQLHAQSVVAFTGNMYFGNVDGPFRSFVHVTLIHERAAVPAAGCTWVPGQRDGAGGMEAFDEE
ncbi:hypothetical protein [Achromobacter deleyi]|uniref:hypothetical protein n=1 Tax=Achromobacter deleyi TaxID=1353891 RepID=UPI001E4646F4|nr:hypothetical protein [Achromobacter deleyi]